MIAKAESRLGYLKIVTPKRGGSGRSNGRSHFVLREGKMVEGSGASYAKGALKSGVDPDDIAKHNQLMRRQYFMDRK